MIILLVLVQDNRLAYCCLKIMRIIFVTNIPSPYQMDFFSSLNENADFDFEVLFCAKTESDRQFSIPKAILFKANILEGRRWLISPKDGHYVPGFAAILQSMIPFDMAVVSGSYFMPATIQTRHFLWKNNIPWYYWGENPEKKEKMFILDILKKAYIKRFLSTSKGIFGVGSNACQVYMKYLDRSKNIFNLPYAPNLEPLLMPSDELKEQAIRIKALWSVGKDDLIVLFAGSLNKRKAPDLLVKAFINCAKNHQNIRLLFAGDGPLRSNLEDMVKNAGMMEHVCFLGFLEGNALKAAYLAADLFVLPTRTHEGWGVVVQEALAAGLPVILSNRVGSACDLINDETGRIFNVDDDNGLREVLCEVIENGMVGDKKRSQTIREFVKDWSSEVISRKFAAFLKSECKMVELS